MADGIVETIEKGVKAPLKGAKANPVAWAIGILLVVLLAWRFRQQLAGFLYSLPVVGSILAQIAGDTAPA